MVYSFQFAVKGEYTTVANAVRQASQRCGRGAKEHTGGEFVFRSSVPGSLGSVKFTLYISESNQVTTLRFMCKTTSSKSYVLAAYDHFLVSLEATGLEIPVVPGKPYIVTSLQLGGGLEQQYTTRQQFSMSGALVGGLVFGDLGAIIGGYNGARKTYGKTVLSRSALFLLCYSNGMVEEKEVHKNSKLYAEVMAKLNATPVIQKATSVQAQTNNSTVMIREIALAILIPLLIYAVARIVILFCKMPQ